MRSLIQVILLFLFCLPVMAQDDPQARTTDKVLNFPSRLFSRIQHKTADLNQQLTKQTEKYLAKMARREEKLRRKLYGADSNAAKQLFDGSVQRYAAMADKMRSDTGSRNQSLKGEYQANTDSLTVMMKYLGQGGQATEIAGAAGAGAQLQALQAKMQDADQIRDYIKQRKQQIGDYISQHAGLGSSLGKEYQGINQDLYYYSQQVRQYKEMLNDPDKLEAQALAMLNKLPAFQAFMKQNSQLAGLFNLPSNYGDPAALAGLQSRDQVSTLINGQVAAGGTEGQAALQSNMQSAQSQLDGYKNKLDQLGSGSGDIDMPNFKPNGQKTKTFWKRLEYGSNFQTTHSNYYFPTVSDLGLSLGYKINNSSTMGIGASYKVGWGNGWNHITLSSQGVGLRSFADVKIKGSFFASGGFEYNYTTPFSSMQQLHNWSDWSQSGLVGISKIISVKSRAFRKTKVSLLWDFLSYSQVPKTQPLLFRIGYMWH
jgi:hypothetical protein